jgi:alkanesulfonate monooxygenase SsuD/methylene tetrahydromethanopterin reductase-like flavin-dependent oxidoreductase (luciferase family)
LGHEHTQLFHEPDELNAPFEEKVSELLGYFRNTSSITVNPENVWPPELWMLGSGTVSVHQASTSGTFFCFAEFLAKEGTDLSNVVDHYLSRFQPSVDAPIPRCGIALAGVCAESRCEADRMAGMARTIAVRPTLVGDPGTCARRLRELQQQTGVADFFFLDLCQDPTAHELSFKLLAEAVF